MLIIVTIYASVIIILDWPIKYLYNNKTTL